MHTILVVCGAGASSTFLALRLRRAAAADGLELDVVASALDALPEHLDDATVVLVGPHLASSLDDIAVAAGRHGACAALLADDVFSAPDAVTRTLAQIRTLLTLETKERS